MAKQLRSAPVTATLPLLLILGPAAKMSRTKITLPSLGIDHHLVKPWQQSALLDELMTILDRRAPIVYRPAPDSDRRNDVKPLNILVADDNSINQQVAIGLLAKLGHRADIADNGIEAVERVKDGDFDLVLMDMQMPKMDGLTATRRIRALPAPKGQIRIVAMTANAMASDREACLACGMDDYIAKPIDMGRLADLLKRWGDRLHMAPNAGVTLDHASPRLVVPPAESSDFDGKGLEAITIVDVGTLDELSQAIDLSTLLQRFCDQADGLAEAVVDASAAGNSPTLGKTAHRFKGAALSMGAKRLGALCQSIERLGKAGDIDAAQPLVAGLKEMTALSCRALQDYRARL